MISFRAVTAVRFRFHHTLAFTLSIKFANRSRHLKRIVKSHSFHNDDNDFIRLRLSGKANISTFENFQCKHSLLSTHRISIIQFIREHGIFLPSTLHWHAVQLASILSYGIRYQNNIHRISCCMNIRSFGCDRYPNGNMRMLRTVRFAVVHKRHKNNK